jgi:hypothetical protein
LGVIEEVERIVKKQKEKTNEKIENLVKGVQYKNIYYL